MNLQVAEQILHKISFPNLKRVSLSQLTYMAYTGQYDLVYSIFKSLPIDERLNYCNKYILNQCIWAGIEKIKKFHDLYMEHKVAEEKLFVDEILNLFIDHCKSKHSFPRELFQSINYWTSQLIFLSFLDDAYSFLKKSIELGVNKFPDLRLNAQMKIVEIHNQNGNIDDAYQLLFNIAKRPYFVTDWNQIPEILFNLSQLALKRGDSEYYKSLLFLGLRLFYTNTNVRESFVAQLRFTYRRSIDLILSSEVNILNKFFYSLHWLVGKIPDLKKIHLGIINRSSKYILLAYIYFHNFLIRNQPIILKEEINSSKINSHSSRGNSNLKVESDQIRKAGRVLITRAMGGIGDFLMMTPGFYALKKKYPTKEIHLAIPKRYFPIFENNTDVKLIDIENEAFSHLNYKKWFNFSNCPAARIESLTAPKVSKNRIAIFSKALGLNIVDRFKMDKTPRYFLKESEIEFANKFIKTNNLHDQKLVGIQLHSDETYRDYPLMEQLVEVISNNYSILLFDSEPIDGYNYNNVIKIQALPLRKAFAIASQCDVIIAPDSSFVHFAASQKLPTIALFGPIDGKIRTKDYPNCTYINIKEEFGCVPCWRNENIPCKLTGMRASVCMENIPTQKLINELNKLLSRKKNHEKY